MDGDIAFHRRKFHFLIDTKVINLEFKLWCARGSCPLNHPIHAGSMLKNFGVLELVTYYLLNLLYTLHGHPYARKFYTTAPHSQQNQLADEN
jgi:hypothetical protein